MEKYQQFLKRNPNDLSVSQFWIESFHESEQQLEGLLDLCVLELTATPSPQSCEVYLKRRAEIPMGSFDHNLFLKLKSRIQGENFKDEKIRRWLSQPQDSSSDELVSSADLKLLTQKLQPSKILVQGIPIDGQSLSRNQVYQWTFLREDAYPLTVLASHRDLTQIPLAWIKIEKEDVRKLERKFPNKRFVQLNSDGELDSRYESQLSPFHDQTKHQLTEQKSWGRWKLPLSLLVTGILVHSLKDKEIKITGLSF
jgi:hypothetical protein